MLDYVVCKVGVRFILVFERDIRLAARGLRRVLLQVEACVGDERFSHCACPRGRALFLMQLHRLHNSILWALSMNLHASWQQQLEARGWTACCQLVKSWSNVDPCYPRPDWLYDSSFNVLILLLVYSPCIKLNSHKLILTSRSSRRSSNGQGSCFLLKLKPLSPMRLFPVLTAIWCYLVELPAI